MGVEVSIHDSGGCKDSVYTKEITAHWAVVGLKLLENSFSLSPKLSLSKALLSLSSSERLNGIFCSSCLVAKSCLTLLQPHVLVARQAPPSRGFPRQECWSELPFPSPVDLP